MTLTLPSNTFAPEVPREWAASTFNNLLAISLKRSLTVPELAQMKRARVVMLNETAPYGALTLPCVTDAPTVPLWLAISLGAAGFCWLMLTADAGHGWHVWAWRAVAVYLMTWGIRKLPAGYKHADLGPWL